MIAFNYQKRPYRAVCVQWNGDNADEIINMLEDAQVFREEYIVVRHQGGMHTLRLGDWVISGEDGTARFYTNEVFSIKYEGVAA